MSTHILPHNFVELLEAEIAILEGQRIYHSARFPTAASWMPPSMTKAKGKSSCGPRSKIADPKTVVITEICYGTTTESLIRSIDEAAKRGKNQNRSDQRLHSSKRWKLRSNFRAGSYAQELIDALYAYTECEVTLTFPNVVIKDDLPWEPNVA